MEWYEYSLIARRDYSSVERCFSYNWDYPFDWSCRRGILERPLKMKFLWYGSKRGPYDFILAPVDGVELMSGRVLKLFEETEITGFETRPVEFLDANGTELEYYMIVTPNEYVSRCFRKCEPGYDIYQKVFDPVFEGLDETVSDFWIGPMEKNDQTAICSDRVVKLVKKHRLTNIEFTPIADVSLHDAHPERYLCNESN